jgi:hypothetical protein
VLPLGELRRADDTSAVISLDDVGIVAVADGLHLVSISRRRIIEPQVFQALALAKQAPPLARFLATLTRGFLARYMEFDWGPATTRLPYLPASAIARPSLPRLRGDSPPPITPPSPPTRSAGTTPSPRGGTGGNARTRWNCTTTTARYGCPSPPPRT